MNVLITKYNVRQYKNVPRCSEEVQKH